MNKLNLIHDYYDYCDVLHQKWFDKTLQYENNQVSGSLWGDITDEENGYYAQYTGEINGTIIGNKLNITITTEIEGYSEENTETWVLKNEWTLIRNNNYFKLIECRD